jgi:hypothetical protein
MISSIVENNTALYSSPLYGIMGSAVGKFEKIDNDDVTSAVLCYWSELSDRIKERLSMEAELFPVYFGKCRQQSFHFEI